jgi:hypothetical protein
MTLSDEPSSPAHTRITRPSEAKSSGDPKTRVPSKFRAAATLGSALTLMSVAGILVACSAHSKTSGVSAPPPAASPERVGRLYLRAAFTGNCGLTAELTLSQTWSWCQDPKLLDYRSAGKAYFVPASEAGRNEECVPFEMYTHGSSDGTMPTGWQPWELCFVRTRTGWRLYDQGQG